MYSNLGDWPAQLEASVLACKLGETSVGAVDYGLYAYVDSFFEDAKSQGNMLCGLYGLWRYLPFSAYFSGDPLQKSIALRQEFYQETIRVYKR